MSYTVEIKKEAEKVLAKIPSKIQAQIRAKIAALAVNPRAPGPMGGFSNRYRFRQGDYRVIYEVEDDRMVVVVVKVGARGDVYKAGGG